MKNKDAPVASKHSFDFIDAYADTLLMDTLIHSLSVGVYFKGEKISKHYGALDKGQSNRPSDKTIYDIASVTKTFVGTIIAQAEMEGKLSLEDDVQKYLDEPFQNLAFQDQPIRIKHLVTHTSGLPRFLPESINDLFSEINDELPFKIAAIQQNYSKTKFLKDLQQFSIDTLPGTNFMYSNADTELAAYLLEKIYGKSFDEILEANICARANMSDTRIHLNEEQTKRWANGYGPNGKTTPLMKTNLWGGSGAGKSTIHDLLNYIQFQLEEKNQAAKKTHQVLYDDSVVNGNPTDRLGYFWTINSDRDFGKLVYHHGGAFGTQNLLLLFPEKDLGISIISNQGHWETGGKLFYVVNGILSEMVARNLE